MTVSEALSFGVGLDTSRFKSGAREIEGTATNTTNKVKQSFSGLNDTLLKTAGLFGLGLGVGTLVQGFLNVNRETERLMGSLKTVTGSAENAKMAFDGISKFAAETPYQIEDVARAFVKLKSMGLDPSDKALRSYGNTASAMGKDLNSMIEAVADAATGEFERLKEFGIRAKQQGDQVSFTFQGVTTTVGKNAKEIEGYLRSIGEVQFAGAMNDQMNTMNGIISNIEDNLSSVARAIGGEGGVNSEMATLLATFRDWTGELAENPKLVGAWASVAVEGISTLIDGFATLIRLVFIFGNVVGNSLRYAGAYMLDFFNPSDFSKSMMAEAFADMKGDIKDAEDALVSFGKTASGIGKAAYSAGYYSTRGKTFEPKGIKSNGLTGGGGSGSGGGLEGGSMGSGGAEAKTKQTEDRALTLSDELRRGMELAGMMADAMNYKIGTDTPDAIDAQRRATKEAKQGVADLEWMWEQVTPVVDASITKVTNLAVKEDQAQQNAERLKDVWQQGILSAMGEANGLLDGLINRGVSFGQTMASAVSAITGKAGSFLGGKLGSYLGGKVGSYFGGPVGGAIGGAIGKMLGGTIGKGIGRLFGGSGPPRPHGETQSNMTDEQRAAYIRQYGISEYRRLPRAREGMILPGGSGAFPILAHGGESVLTARATDYLGRDAIRQMNANPSGMAMQGVSVTMIFNGQVEPDRVRMAVRDALPSALSDAARKRRI